MQVLRHQEKCSNEPFGSKSVRNAPIRGTSSLYKTNAFERNELRHAFLWCEAVSDHSACIFVVRNGFLSNGMHFHNAKECPTLQYDLLQCETPSALQRARPQTIQIRRPDFSQSPVFRALFRRRSKTFSPRGLLGPRPNI